MLETFFGYRTNLKIDNYCARYYSVPVSAEGRVEHQKRTQTATTLRSFGFVFGVQLGSLEKQNAARTGPCRTGTNVSILSLVLFWIIFSRGKKCRMWVEDQRPHSYIRSQLATFLCDWGIITRLLRWGNSYSLLHFD